MTSEQPTTSAVTDRMYPLIMPMSIATAAAAAASGASSVRWTPAMNVLNHLAPHRGHLSPGNLTNSPGLAGSTDRRLLSGGQRVMMMTSSCAAGEEAGTNNPGVIVSPTQPRPGNSGQLQHKPITNLATATTGTGAVPPSASFFNCAPQSAFPGHPSLPFFTGYC